MYSELIVEPGLLSTIHLEHNLLSNGALSLEVLSSYVPRIFFSFLLCISLYVHRISLYVPYLLSDSLVFSSSFFAQVINLIKYQLIVAQVLLATIK